MTEYIKRGDFGIPYIPVLNGEEKIKQGAFLIQNTKRICVITGAGMSTDSGIPDFRSKFGLYSEVPEDFLSIKNFKNNPLDVYKFIYSYINTLNVEPNTGHYLISKLEELGKEVTIITQNIDGLHAKAGSSKVLEMHGTLKTATCLKCNKQYKMDEIIDDDIFYYECDCKGLIKPDIVFFGENIHHLNEATKKIKMCDLLIILGTSMQVFPVAGLPDSLKAGVPIIIINKDSTPIDDDRMAVVFHENISDTLKDIMNYVK